MKKLSGFTIVRNGIEFDYPFLESIQSALPLVDEFIINVGVGTDSTLAEIQKLAQKHKKIKYFESNWQLDDPQKKRDGLILSEQTNLALERCQNDWCLYLQADEVLHEKDHKLLSESVQTAESEVQGILFEYLHFYGSYNVVQKTRSAYRREVRIVKKSSGARSVGDAQSFRNQSGTKLRVLQTPARIFHYGWVRPPEKMKEKTFFFDQLYHGDPNSEDQKNHRPHTGDNYRYKRFWGLWTYTGTHPEIMKQRIQTQGWKWDLESSKWTFKVKDLKKIVLDLFERVTGIRLFEYRSYRIIGRAKP